MASWRLGTSPVGSGVGDDDAGGQRAVEALEPFGRQRQRHVVGLVDITSGRGGLVTFVAELCEQAERSRVRRDDRRVEASKAKRSECEGVQHHAEPGAEPLALDGALADEDRDLGAVVLEVAEIAIAHEPSVELEEKRARTLRGEAAVVRDHVVHRQVFLVGEHRPIVRFVVEGRESRGGLDDLGARRLASDETIAAVGELDDEPGDHGPRLPHPSYDGAMAEGNGWRRIEDEARQAIRASRHHPLPAYSELMPPPYLRPKPYELWWPGAARPDEAVFDVSEYQQADELEPGLAHVAGHLLGELSKLVAGRACELSRALLTDNAAWPAQLSDAAHAGRLASAPLVIFFPLALSRTQDDKGNVPWTLFGASHEGASRPFWRSFAPHEAERFANLCAWATGDASSAPGAVRVLGTQEDLPDFARVLALADGSALDGVQTLLTFRPFATLPEDVRQAYVDGRLRLLPHPASLVFFEHAGYRRLAEALPRARQIPLLHLFPRIEGGYTLRIPQSGWLDEADAAARPAHGHKIVRQIVRTHRWQRAQRDAGLGGDGTYTDDVSVALFSSDADDLGLYGKPMARNAQVWREDYGLILDGPSAERLELENAAAAVEGGGRFGYRFYYPPLRMGARELFWHRPLIAKLGPSSASPDVLADGAPMGYVLAEAANEPPIELAPRVLDRAGHRTAARLRDHTGRSRNTTGHNARKLVELAEALGAPLSSSLARAALHVAREETIESWLAGLADPGLALHLRGLLGPDVDPGTALTFAETGTRAFEERVWRSIASLAEGPLRNKENADVVASNRGRHGGPAARAAGAEAAQRRDLERLGDELHSRYRALLDKHEMTGRAYVADHRFRWETDFDFSWSEGWVQNQSRQAHERNIVLLIPGRNRGEAVVMGDHYDTAYMEDVFEEDQGGDGLRVAAAGADDNHSATTALLLAADVLLPLAREGRLERDVWLVHLTGEEFPSDCMGARALARALVERRLRFVDEAGAVIDVSAARVVGAFILDMIGHNNPRDRDVFQIAPGEGAAAAKLAARAHAANMRWNRAVSRWNSAPERKGLARAERREHGRELPPPFAHLALRGEVRPEWDPRSALYNTDGQIFSDVGVPVVLFMENYDISRTGYHDTHDTMKNIDLDYAAALTAIAIETVAQTACAPEI